jgi:membrane protein
MRTAELRDRLITRFSPERARLELDRLAVLSERGALRTIKASVRGFQHNNDLLWASALTYTSGLSIVPILAIGLSAIKGLGGLDRIRPLIEHYLAANSPEITDQILNFVGNVSAKALGEVGGAVLLVTVVLTLGTIEQAFNTIFNAARGRTLARKFSDYLSVTFTLPLLMVAAVAVRGELLRKLPHLPGVALLVSGLMVWSGFFFLYVFFPNTKVSWRAALIGGLVASIFLQLGQWGYVYFQVGAGNYQAIYGALAAVPILLTWIYMAWVIVLYGAELTAAAQGITATFNLDHRTPSFVRIAALLTVFRAGERMMNREAPAPVCTAHALAAELGVSESALEPVLDRLKRGGIIVESAERSAGRDRSPGLFLARDSSAISIAEVLECLDKEPASFHGDGRIVAILEGLTAAEREMLGSLTVQDLVAGRIAAPPEASERIAQEQ